MEKKKKIPIKDKPTVVEERFVVSPLNPKAEVYVRSTPFNADNILDTVRAGYRFWGKETENHPDWIEFQYRGQTAYIMASKVRKVNGHG